MNLRRTPQNNPTNNSASSPVVADATPDLPVAQQAAVAGDIEQAIERIGARYVADLRALSEEFGRFYNAQLTAKDEQIAELSRFHDTQLAARDEQVAELSRRLEVAERDRSSLEARLRKVTDTGAQYVSDLRTLSEELNRRLEAAARDREDLDARVQQGELESR